MANIAMFDNIASIVCWQAKRAQLLIRAYRWSMLELVWSV